jgi:hypothetical protein
VAEAGRLEHPEQIPPILKTRLVENSDQIQGVVEGAINPATIRTPEHPERVAWLMRSGSGVVVHGC